VGHDTAVVVLGVVIGTVKYVADFEVLVGPWVDEGPEPVEGDEEEWGKA